MTSLATAVLVIFARRPEAGRVKTRLARAIGDAAAAALYAAFVSDLRDRFAAAPFAVRWAVAPPVDGFAERFAIAPGSVFAQRGDDLGARMRDALGRVLGEGFPRCAIVGSDMPQLEVDAVRRAFARLEDADVVLGPAEDGGYYLVAARAVLEIFDGIAWGTESVLAATRWRAAALGLTVALLEPGFDVDVEKDLERLRAVAGSPAAPAMPATAAALAAIRSSKAPPRTRSS
jgi:hypothetical protein